MGNETSTLNARRLDNDQRVRSPVVVFDLDGTLLGAGNEIIGGDDTVKALYRLRSLGAELAICTGRLDHDVKIISDRYALGIHDRISQHGAVLVKGDEYRATLLDEDEARAFYAYARDLPIRMECNTVSNRYWTSERPADFPRELYDSHVIKENYDELISCQPVVLFLMIGEEGELLKIKSFVDAHCVLSKAVLTSRTSLEIMSQKASKGLALRTLYSGHPIFAIGDSPNDYDMFPMAERSYLVSNMECPYEVDRTPTILEALLDIERRLSSSTCRVTLR